MTAPRDHSVYLTDILNSIASIERYTADMAPTQFMSDTKTQDAVVRNLEVIGEAVKRIPEDVRNTAPSLAWHPAAAMRDFLIHEYPAIDAEAVWNTIVHDLPPFKKGVQEMLEKRGHI